MDNQSEISVKLFNMIADGCKIQDILDFAWQILGNPIFLRDLGFNVLAYTRDVIVNDIAWASFTGKGYQSDSDISFMRFNEMLQIIEKYSVPVYFKKFGQDDPVDTDVEIVKDNYVIIPQRIVLEKTSRVWAKVCIGRKPAAHLVILEYFKPFEESDFAFFRLLTTALSILMQVSNPSSSQGMTLFECIISDILDGKITDNNTLNEKLKCLEFSVGTNMCLLVIRSLEEQRSAVPEQFLKMHLGRITGGRIVIYKRYLNVIFDCCGSEPTSGDRNKRLESFLAENCMAGAFSARFDNFLEIKKHFNLAINTIDFGLRRNPNKTSFYYENYIVEHLLNGYTSAEALKDFCHPSILTLIDYDSQNGTCYYQSLKAYIDNLKKPGRSAESLYIHRNTLNYRIRKIEEIMDVDLSDTDCLFRIYLSFKILEMYN